MTEPVSLRPQFEPVARRTVPDEIRDALRHSIRSGGLIPGARMPSERALCEQFRVGRTTVREALQGMLSVGEIERRGQGYYVAEGLPGVTLDGFDPRKDRVRELFEVRRLLEVAMVRRCCERASSADIDAIVGIAKAFTPSMKLSDFRCRDREFHWAIARGSHNSMLVEVYGKVLDTLFRSEEFSSLLWASANARTVRRVIRHSGVMHQQIAAALVQRDADAAVAALEGHLDTVEVVMTEEMV